MQIPMFFSRSRLGLAGAAAAALALGQPALADDHAQDDEASEALTKGEKELAELLEGRVAGEPTSCIRNRLNSRLRVIDETAYVYGRGKTIYVQRTRHPERIDSDDILISRRFGSGHICKVDIVSTADRYSGFFNGAIFFDDFIPYTRVEDAEDQG